MGRRWWKGPSPLSTLFRHLRWVISFLEEFKGHWWPRVPWKNHSSTWTAHLGLHPRADAAERWDLGGTWPPMYCCCPALCRVCRDSEFYMKTFRAGRHIPNNRTVQLLKFPWVCFWCDEAHLSRKMSAPNFTGILMAFYTNNCSFVRVGFEVIQ